MLGQDLIDRLREESISVSLQNITDIVLKEFVAYGHVKNQVVCGLLISKVNCFSFSVLTVMYSIYLPITDPAYIH
jgi:hypothetical protein